MIHCQQSQLVDCFRRILLGERLILVFDGNSGYNSRLCCYLQQFFPKGQVSYSYNDDKDTPKCMLFVRFDYEDCDRHLIPSWSRYNSVLIMTNKIDDIHPIQGAHCFRFTDNKRQIYNPNNTRSSDHLRHANNTSDLSQNFDTKSDIHHDKELMQNAYMLMQLKYSHQIVLKH